MKKKVTEQIFFHNAWVEISCSINFLFWFSARKALAKRPTHTHFGGETRWQNMLNVLGSESFASAFQTPIQMPFNGS